MFHRTITVLALTALLSGCGQNGGVSDGTVQSYSETDVDEQAGRVSALDTGTGLSSEARTDAAAADSGTIKRQPEQRGLFGLLGGQRRTSQPATGNAAGAAGTGNAAGAAGTGNAAGAAGAGNATAASTAKPTLAAASSGGFLGGLLGGGAGGQTKGMDMAEVTANTLLPFGQLGRVCGVSQSALGQTVATHRGYRLIDSAPGTTSPHPLYLSGLDGGCAVVFTGALAIFGGVEMHEQLRYGLPDAALPYSDTDTAYEKVKADVCNVGRKKPCGNRIGRLDRDTVFLSVYERYGDNARWSNLLIHDGGVVAQDVVQN